MILIRFTEIIEWPYDKKEDFIEIVIDHVKTFDIKVCSRFVKIPEELGLDLSLFR